MWLNCNITFQFANFYINVKVFMYVVAIYDVNIKKNTFKSTVWCFPCYGKREVLVLLDTLVN